MAMFLIIFASAAFSETEVGVSGQLAWGIHSYFNDPAGYSLFVRQSLFGRLLAQFQYDYITESGTFQATVYTVLPPRSEEDAITDNFRSKAWAHTFELALLYNFIDYKLMSINAGGGLDLTYADANVFGIESGFRFPDPYKQKLGFSFLADFSLQCSYSLPLVFHLGLREEITGSEYTCTDCYTVFDDALNFTELRFGISYIFWPSSR